MKRIELNSLQTMMPGLLTWRSNPPVAPGLRCCCGVPDNRPGNVNVLTCATQDSSDRASRISVFPHDDGPTNPSHTGSPANILADTVPSVARIGVWLFNSNQRSKTCNVSLSGDTGFAMPLAGDGICGCGCDDPPIWPWPFVGIGYLPSMAVGAAASCPHASRC